MNFKMRRLESDDLSFLREMIYESAFVPEGKNPFPRTILDNPSVSKFWVGWGGQLGDIGFIAEIERQPVGAVWLRLFDGDKKSYGDQKTPELGIAILSEFRGRGVGNALMHELEMQARTYGYQKLSLSVDPRNPAWRLYEKRAYVHVGWDDTYWVMEKSLC